MSFDNFDVPPTPTTNTADHPVIVAVTNYKNEAEAAARDRKLQNLENFDTYHLKEDFTYKKKGQSKEFLPKVFMGVEQIVSFIQQGLADLGTEWYSLELEDGLQDAKEPPKITDVIIKKLLDRQLNKANFYRQTGLSLKAGLLQSLMILKVHGRWVEKPYYKSKEVVRSEGGKIKMLFKTKDTAWELVLDVVMAKDYHPDPTGRKLYELHDIEMDLHDIRRQVKSEENPYGIYDKDAVDQLTGDYMDLIKDALNSRESGQNVTMSSYRHRVIITECWGDIIDQNGNVLHENIVCAVAKGKYLIRPPQENPLWHGESPFVVSPLVDVPNSVWHKALMDGPAKLNRAQNEIYNLSLDAGLMSVYGIKQMRTDWMADPSLVDDGFYPGQTVEANSQCPPGGKVLESVITGEPLAEGLQMYNLTNAEAQQAMLTNDLRLGVMPDRQVKATAIVESSQSITGMLNGVAKSIENLFIDEVLRKSWMTCAQHLNDFDQSETKKLLGEKDAGLLKSMSNSEIFAETVNGLSFKVFGISNVLNKQKDFRRITALLQTISASEVLIEEFAKEFSFSRLMQEILKSLDINVDKLKLSDSESDQQQVQKLMQQQAAQQQGAGQGGAAGSQQSGSPTPNAQPQAPKAQSQIAQVASARSGPIPQENFPPSRATGALKPQ